MFSRADFPTNLITFSKDLVTTPTYDGMTFRLNTTGRAFAGANGVGTSTATSTAAFIHAGGWPDQRITARMLFVAPTVAGGEDFGVMMRGQSLEDAASQNYYYARCSAGLAKLTKVVGGAFTNMATAAFPIAAGVPVDIMLEGIGSAIRATFQAVGGVPANVTLNAVDSAIPQRGLMGFRTLSSTGYCQSFTVEQL
jgi:hypothetical protein